MSDCQMERTGLPARQGSARREQCPWIGISLGDASMIGLRRSRASSSVQGTPPHSERQNTLVFWMALKANPPKICSYAHWIEAGPVCQL
jgi:hypothetical protein